MDNISISLDKTPIVVSTDKDNLSFQSVDDVLKFVQTSTQKNIELWISGEQP